MDCDNCYQPINENDDAMHHNDLHFCSPECFHEYMEALEAVDACYRHYGDPLNAEEA